MASYQLTAKSLILLACLLPHEVVNGLVMDEPLGEQIMLEGCYLGFKRCDACLELLLLLQAQGELVHLICAETQRWCWMTVPRQLGKSVHISFPIRVRGLRGFCVGLRGFTHGK